MHVHVRGMEMDATVTGCEEVNVDAVKESLWERESKVERLRAKGQLDVLEVVLCLEEIKGAGKVDEAVLGRDWEVRVCAGTYGREVN